MRFTLFVVVVFAALYWFPMRRWMSRWGASPEELSRTMAGDGLLDRHTYSGTLAITMHARPEDLWPWLVQIGYQRGGLYSYDWLDRIFGFLDRPSANRILPEFQRLAVGDTIPVGQGPGWPVATLDPNRALVLDMTCAIEPAGFIMTRRMLLGLKERAEATRAARVRDRLADLVPAA